MKQLTAFGIEPDGRAVVDFIETDTGARVDAAAHLDAPELRHVATLATELAVNAEKRAASHDLPMAADGLTSYRCKGRYGFIMIGATGHEDALREARRSSDAAQLQDLEVWVGDRYVSVLAAADPKHAIARDRDLPAFGSFGGC